MPFAYGISVVTCCQEMFRVELPSEIIEKRLLVKFESKCDILFVN